MDYTELARAQTRIAKLSSALLGCRDMLKESAKQHRLNDDGHDGLCESHARVAEAILCECGWLPAERETDDWYQKGI